MKRRWAVHHATDATAASPHTNAIINAGSSTAAAGASVLANGQNQRHGGTVRAENIPGGGANVGFSVV